MAGQEPFFKNDQNAVKSIQPPVYTDRGQNSRIAQIQYPSCDPASCLTFHHVPSILHTSHTYKLLNVSQMLNCFTPPHPFSCCSLPLTSSHTTNSFYLFSRFCLNTFTMKLFLPPTTACPYSSFFPCPHPCTHCHICFDLHRTGKWYEYAPQLSDVEKCHIIIFF